MSTRHRPRELRLLSVVLVALAPSVAGAQPSPAVAPALAPPVPAAATAPAAAAPGVESRASAATGGGAGGSATLYAPSATLGWG
ncbi:MAG: protein kinase, partial [Myxococcales bacterium]